MTGIWLIVTMWVVIFCLSLATCIVIWSRGPRDIPFFVFFKAAIRYNRLIDRKNDDANFMLNGRQDVIICQNLSLFYAIVAILSVGFVEFSR